MKGFAAMDHEDAIQTHASMRYALGELTEAERDSFEEHFADCSLCMRDVEAAVVFTANAKEVFRERAAEPVRPKQQRWFGWRPAPAFAFSALLNLVLAAGVGYQLLQHRPLPTADVTNSVEPVEVVAVHGATRSDPGMQVVQTSGGPLVLSFDLPQRYERYLYSIRRGDTPAFSGEVNVTGRTDSLNLRIPVSRLVPGEYLVAVTGVNGASRDTLGSCLLQIPPR
jgi:hypothetical protein